MDLAARREQRFCRFQIGRLEALREPVIDRLEHRRGFGPASLVAPQAGQAYGSAPEPSTATGWRQ
jgi:hypothetical protein